MSDFKTALLALLSGAGNRDVRVPLVWLYEYRFRGATVRLWAGKGPLVSTDGRNWAGTVDPLGRDLHQFPEFGDGRDGSAATLSITFPFFNKDRWDEIVADLASVSGRLLTVYRGLWADGEGIRPLVPIEFVQEFTLLTALPSQETRRQPNGDIAQIYGLSLTVKNGNALRSAAPNRTYTPASQRQYAATFGVADDKGMDFVPSLYRKSLTFP